MKIGLLVYPGCVVYGLFAFAELLEVANKRAGKSLFSILWLGVDDKGVVITTGGYCASIYLAMLTLVITG